MLFRMSQQRIISHILFKYKHVCLKYYIWGICRSSHLRIFNSIDHFGPNYRQIRFLPLRQYHYQNSSLPSPQIIVELDPFLPPKKIIIKLDPSPLLESLLY